MGDLLRDLADPGVILKKQVKQATPICVSFSALTLLVRRQKQHQASRKLCVSLLMVTI